MIPQIQGLDTAEDVELGWTRRWRDDVTIAPRLNSTLQSSPGCQQRFKPGPLSRCGPDHFAEGGSQEGSGRVARFGNAVSGSSGGEASLYSKPGRTGLLS